MCSRDIENESVCQSDEVCASGRCVFDIPEDGVCAPKLMEGELCGLTRDCETGACRRNVTPALCGTPLLNGEPCEEHEACESGHCRYADGETTCAEPPTQGIGDSCLIDADCTTDTCRGGQCWAEICGDYLE